MVGLEPPGLSQVEKEGIQAYDVEKIFLNYKKRQIALAITLK